MQFSKITFITLVCVFAPFASATAASPYNDPTKNIFDTLDSTCDPTTAGANGIVFCDGNEDGIWFPNLVACGNGGACNDCGTIECDYWQKAQKPWSNDPLQTGYTECNSGTVNPDKANFGAAGSRCTATMGYIQNSGQGINASHYTHADASGQPKPVGTYHYFVRFYFKESGRSSERCPGGWPNCPAYAQNGPNGYKVIEGEHFRQWGGINAGVLGTISPTSNFTWGGGCVNNANQNQNVSKFDHTVRRDEWIFVEMEVRETTNGIFKLWMDSCGKDGKSCPATPTLRANHTGDFHNTCTPASTGAKVRSLWMNFWNSSSTGEIQWDELVVRDGEKLAQPIGFARTVGGSSPTQPPLPSPVLLDN